jgi:hypothetical protein
MENNKMNNIENLDEQKQKNNATQQTTNLNESNNPKQSLTNEQKLEYISHLIQEVEQNLEEKGISKTLVRKDDSLK